MGMDNTFSSCSAYSTDVHDEEWVLVAPYLILSPEVALRWIVRTGILWRLLATDFPPWPIVYQRGKSCGSIYQDAPLRATHRIGSRRELRGGVMEEIRNLHVRGFRLARASS
jgi:transposase